MATELANAYVQIVPSAQGIKGKLTDVLGGESDEAGVSVGKRLVGKIMGVVSAAGIGTAISAAISEGAELEQTLGGIETLFKDNADKVKQYASEAFKTTGLSANDYMQTVTSFSASLLQGLGGDTNKAADVANMALTDMSDNANKMGTSMELIQNAYQGFAKQNYTMLDNLKLGYGGTKTEMQRLLKDAEAFSGVKYDINNLSDVYEAIHVIQEEMDITGTTAKEASSTISGSFASMKAALSDFLGNMALGNDVVPSLNNLIQTTYTFLFNNLLPAIGNVIKAIPSVLMSLIPQIVDTAQSLIGEFTAFLDGAFPSLMTSGSSMVTNIVNGILEGIPGVITSAGELLNNFLGALLDSLPQILATGFQMITGLVQGIISNLPAIRESIIEVVAKMVATFFEKLPDILESGIQTMLEFAAGIIQAIPDVIAEIPKVFESIKNKFAEFDWKKIGSDIIDGIKNGITAGLEAIKKAAEEAAKKALDAAKEALGIASPSKEFFALGEFSSIGLAQGILAKAKTVADAMRGVSSDVLNTYDTTLSAGMKTSGLSSVKADSGMYARLDILIMLLERYLPECALPATIDGESLMDSINRQLGMAVAG